MRSDLVIREEIKLSLRDGRWAERHELTHQLGAEGHDMDAVSAEISDMVDAGDLTLVKNHIRLAAGRFETQHFLLTVVVPEGTEIDLDDLKSYADDYIIGDLNGESSKFEPFPFLHLVEDLKLPVKRDAEAQHEQLRGSFLKMFGVQWED